MKPKQTLLTLVIATATLALAAPASQAQALPAPPVAIPSKPPAYYIAEFELTDPEGIAPYRAAVDATFKPYSGRYIVRAASVNRLEGDPPSHRLVIIKFDSLAQAQAWYNSPEYARIRPFRQRSGHTNAYIVEGDAQ
ncbi:DUF1330 domain-containing protein [Xanthomonas sp. LMG 8992]|uniref:DUF1330 domain-containing protein n=1 Tax=Xanthomonas sp. LMG 8992 TaxID=1591157 RepID=UPI00136C39B9|nr:DUF1330 domain-containing protein [Xanthomonas sp. LMG 8992]MXV12241.1 DUF1330 domain-containing protein [Xanthomonas sp. LMG 8992]